jgi:hypothetical protein
MTSALRPSAFSYNGCIQGFLQKAAKQAKSFKSPLLHKNLHDLCFLLLKFLWETFTEGSEANKDWIGLELFALFVSFCLRFFQLAALLRIGLDD